MRVLAVLFHLFLLSEAQWIVPSAGDHTVNLGTVQNLQFSTTVPKVNVVLFQSGNNSLEYIAIDLKYSNMTGTNTYNYNYDWTVGLLVGQTNSADFYKVFPTSTSTRFLVDVFNPGSTSPLELGTLEFDIPTSASTTNTSSSSSSAASSSATSAPNWKYPPASFSGDDTAWATWDLGVTQDIEFSTSASTVALVLYQHSNNSAVYVNSSIPISASANGTTSIYAWTVGDTETLGAKDLYDIFPDDNTLFALGLLYDDSQKATLARLINIPPLASSTTVSITSTSSSSSSTASSKSSAATPTGHTSSSASATSGSSTTTSASSSAAQSTSNAGEKVRIGMGASLAFVAVLGW